MTIQTNIPTNNLGQLLQDIDRLQVNRRPLAPHAIANGNDEDKKTYATMLAVLMVNQSISDAQSRLLTMLLHSMDLDIPLSSLYDRVSSFDKQALEAFCELVDSDALAPAFFMDALTLLRLDKPLSEVQVKSLSELTTLLEVTQSVIEDILHLSNKVLQNGDKDAFSVEAMVKAKFQLNLDFDYDSLKPWHEFSFKSLTQDDLNDIVKGGDWILSTAITLNQNLELKNSIVIFSQHGKIKSHHRNVEIKNSYLSNANLEIAETQSINLINNYLLNTTCILSAQNLLLEDCKIIDNKNTKNLDAFILKASSTKIKNCNVEEVCRRVLFFQNSPQVDIEDTSFINCGYYSTLEDKPTIMFDYCDNVNVINSSFKTNSNIKQIKNVRNRGKKRIVGCKFINSSKPIDFNQKAETPILDIHHDFDNRDDIFFTECNFQNVHVLANFTSQNHNDKPFQNSKFKNSYISSNTSFERLVYECNFDNGDKTSYFWLEV